MRIYVNQRLKYKLSINEINKIFYSLPEKRLSIGFVIYSNTYKKIEITSGVFFTDGKEAQKLANYLEEILHDFFINKGFLEEIKTKGPNQAYILTPKNN